MIVQVHGSRRCVSYNRKHNIFDRIRRVVYALLYKSTMVYSVKKGLSEGQKTMDIAPSHPIHETMCPVARTAEILSGKWTILIIRDLVIGVKRFNQLERSLQGISPKTLSERLRSLEEDGIVVRQTFAEAPPRVEYSLTDKGRALVSVIESMRSYGTRWLCSSE
jgi:DNA-binding HxlR family transcriptional regulator